MKKQYVYLSCITCAVVGSALSSCVMRPSADQWERDNTRNQDQLKHYPDRESSKQAEADAEAAGKGRIPVK